MRIFPTFDEIENFLLNNCEAGDLLITMGAGDVVKIGETVTWKIIDCNFSGCHVLLRLASAVFVLPFLLSLICFSCKTCIPSHIHGHRLFAKN